MYVSSILAPGNKALLEIGATFYIFFIPKDYLGCMLYVKKTT